MKEFQQMVEQGDASAQFNLGVKYDNGQGVPQDYQEAVKWYRRAAEQGDASAQYNLGVKYDNGQGVPQDFVEAMKWYRLAAEQGIARAKKSLETLETKMTPEQISEAQRLAREWKPKGK